jgi:DNA ligase-1
VSHLNKGFEGTIVRDPDGRYKFGRSTMREGLLLKIKRFNDAEAVVVGVEELMHNGNEATLDRLGHSKRSSHKGNKMASGKLGALVVENVVNGKRVRFKVGTGFKDNERKQLWSDRNSLIGRYAKYKSMEFGTKDAPRHPVFLGFRHKNDM